MGKLDHVICDGLISKTKKFQVRGSVCRVS